MNQPAITPTPSPFVNPLPGVPHIESPFIDSLFADKGPALQRLASHLHQFGYAVINFPEPELATMAEAIKRNLTPHFEDQGWNQFRQGKNADLRIRDAWHYEPNVRRLAGNQTVLELLSKLYGRRAWPFQTLNFPVGTQQGMHSDAVHFHSVPERFMCAVWVALEDVTMENGPLFYYPGSQRWPVYTNEHLGRCISTLPTQPTQAPFEPVWQALVDVHKAEKQEFFARKGQALIWTANLLHGGSLHLNRNASRWSQVTHYFFEDCAWYAPLFSDPFYGQIYFRRLKNIVTGAMMQQSYAGLPIPDSFIQATRSTHPDGPYAFDKQAYLAANPDVAANGMDALTHYLHFGRKENRKLRP